MISKNQFFPNLSKEFLYGGHLQCFGAIAIILTTALLFQMPLSWDLLLTTYLIFYAIYTYNRLQELNQDMLTNPERTTYLASRTKKFRFTFFIAIIAASIILFLKASFTGLLFSMAILILGLLYTNLFKGFTRTIPGFKNIFVALVFSLLIFLPIFYFENLLYPPHLFTLLLIFSFWVLLKGFTMQIFLDLKDIASDEKADLRTIPILLGEKGTFQLLYILVAISFFSLFYFALKIDEAQINFFALALTGLVSIIGFHFARKGSYTGYLIESGQFISWPVFITLATYFTP